VESQQVPPQQVLPVQQSASWLQVPPPLGIHPTHFPVDSSQIPEQHWASLVQDPVTAIQQVLLLQVWALEQQMVLLLQSLLLGQQDPPMQVLLPVHGDPLPQTQV